MIEPAPDNLTAEREDGANRHLACVARAPRFGERFIHQRVSIHWRA
jgi:hypothetical protein